MSNQTLAPAWANTRVSTKLGIRYPIIQGAANRITPRMVRRPLVGA